jgi:hypothetical protein
LLHANNFEPECLLELQALAVTGWRNKSGHGRKPLG